MASAASEARLSKAPKNIGGQESAVAATCQRTSQVDSSERKIAD